MKKIFCICTILTLATFVVTTSVVLPANAGSENVELVGITPGACFAVAVEGDIAYIGAGVYLWILDITDKSAPALLGSIQLSDLVCGIAVSGGYAYIAAGNSGLRVVDANNPSIPTEKGFYDTPGYANGVAVSGGYAYIADGGGGSMSGSLIVVDVSNLESPTKRGSYDTTPGDARDVAVSGGHAYIAAFYSGLFVIDVNNPECPTKRGFCDAPYAEGVAVSGSYAYVADCGNGLCVVDVSAPAVPTKVGSLDTRYALDVAVSGDYAYVADWESGLRVVYVRDPTNPTEVGFCDTPGEAWDVAVSGDYTYVADIGGGLRVIDVSSSESPKEKGFYDTPGESSDIAVSGDYAYVAESNNGLHVVDVSSPESPKEKGFCNTPGDAEDVAVSDSYAYVADGNSGLCVVDVSNPESPTVKVCYDTQGFAAGVAVSGSYAYIADGENGLCVVDISNPENPIEMGCYDTPGDACGVAVSGCYAYVADGWEDLRIVDISNPKSPKEKGVYDTPSSACRVAVSGGYAYVADYYFGLRVVDVSNPESPVEKEFYDISFLDNVAVSGGYAYIVSAWSILSVVDISNPAHPTEKGFHDTPWWGQDVTVANNLIYVTDYFGEMSIFRFTGAELSAGFVSPSSGPTAGGTEVRIYGTNFKEGATVTIGGKAAINPIVDPAAQMFITAITPPGKPGSADVVVTNPDGAIATLKGGFKYIPPTGDVSGNGTVSAYDAALILQYVVGLITEFPADRLTSPSDVTPQNYELRLPNLTAKIGERIYVPLALNEVSGLFAGGITIKYDANLLRAVNVRPSLSSVYHESNISRPGEIRFAFATVKPVNSAGELLMVEFYVMPNTEGKNSPLLISDAQFSESLSIARNNGSIEVLPAKTALLPNYPNPFNPETWIPYQLSARSYVTVEVYDVHGRLVRVFDLGMQTAGSYVTKDRAVYWNGENESGERVASGVYFYRLKAEQSEAGVFSAMRRLLVVK